MDLEPPHEARFVFPDYDQMPTDEQPPLSPVGTNQSRQVRHEFEFDELELLRRDEAALRYEQNRLTTGDTLVLANITRRGPIYDALGFRLDTEYRVNSRKLIETGSAFFEKKLGREEQSKQIQLYFMGGRVLPEGVKYVLDLSPEHLDGVEMLHALSCPEGICNWFRAQRRNGVAGSVVGGKDESEVPRDLAELLHSSRRPVIGKESKENVEDSGGSKSSDTHEDTKDEKKEDKQGENKDAPKEGESNENEKSNKKNRKNKEGAKDPKDTAFTTAPVDAPVDYSHVRHRACIERLLQIIEGKNARLDSATKVWTVAMLSGIYGCGKAVVDEITSWVFLSLNSVIIEILPEAIFKMGVTLESALLTRAAFRVLVAEAAICLRPDTAPSQRSEITPLGRKRDDFTLGEDYLGMVQKAALTFHESISKEIEPLLNTHSPWLSDCQEYVKLKDLRAKVVLEDETEHLDIQGDLLRKIAALDTDICDWFSGRFRECLSSHLPNQILGDAKEHRVLEHWTTQAPVDIKEYYSKLDPQQRWCTRPFWQLLLVRSVDSLVYSNVTNGQTCNNPVNIRCVTAAEIQAGIEELNLAIFNYMSRKEELPNSTMAFNHTYSSAPYLGVNGVRHRSFTNWYYTLALSSRTPSDAQFLAYELSLLRNSGDSHSSSVFFNLETFCKQAELSIRSKVNEMLRKDEECEGFSISDGLLCLGDGQYKFLPLFAGGCDDGSGGVGVDMPIASTENWDDVPAAIDGNCGTQTATAGETSGATNVVSSVGFDLTAFEKLSLSSLKLGKARAYEPSAADTDTFSELGFRSNVSEISFASTFDGDRIKAADKPYSEIDSRNAAAIEALMSDNFMLEGSGDPEDEGGDDDDTDGFDMLENSDDDNDDDGDDTETED